MILFDSVQHYRSLSQPITVPEVFFRRSKQDMQDLIARKKKADGNQMTESDVKYLPHPLLMSPVSPDSMRMVDVQGWIPPRYRTEELVAFCKELQKAWEKARHLRVR